MTTINRSGSHGGSPSGKTGDSTKSGRSGLDSGPPDKSVPQRKEMRLDLAFEQELQNLRLEWEGRGGRTAPETEPVQSLLLSEMSGRSQKDRGRKGEPRQNEGGMLPQGLQLTGQDSPRTGGAPEEKSVLDWLAQVMQQADRPGVKRKVDGTSQEEKEAGLLARGGQQRGPDRSGQPEQSHRGGGQESPDGTGMRHGTEGVPGGSEGKRGDRKETEPGDPAGELAWLAGLESLPVIAQSAPGLTSLFQSGAPVQGVQQTHPLVDQAGAIVQKMVERAEFGSLPSMKEMSGFHLALDRSVYGIHGVGLTVTQGAVAVVLMGVQAPDAEALAAAGQVLVRELQRYFPNRPIRILAKEDERTATESGGIHSEVEAPVLALSQRDLSRDRRQ